LPAARGGDFGVYKQVLQFCRPGQTDGLKPVAGLPMAQADLLSNPVRIKGLPTGRRLRADKLF